MKVLFALGSEQMSKKVAEKYLEKYGDELEYKNVFYFKALLEEVKKDKTYDRIVISEELEQFALKNLESLDKFIFEKVDNVTDEIEDSEIIFVCSDRRSKDHDKFVERLFNIGVYNTLIGDERNITSLCEYIKNPMNKKEAKRHLNINPIVSGDSAITRDDEVEEVQILNILKYYDGIKGKTSEYIPAFDRIAEQYSKKQLIVILNCLPSDVKRVIASSEKYSFLLDPAEYGGYEVPIENPVKETSNKRGLLFGILKDNKNKEMHRKQPDAPLNNTDSDALIEEKDKLEEEAKAIKQAEEELKKKEEERLKLEKEMMEKQQAELLERAKQEAVEREQKEEKTGEEVSTETQRNEIVEKMKQEITGDEVKMSDQNSVPNVDSENEFQQKLEEERQKIEQEKMALEEARKRLQEQSQQLAQKAENISQTGKDNTVVINNTRKMIVFVGTAKSGTTFLINAITYKLSSNGVRVGLLDMTKSSSLYYIYNQNDKTLRNLAAECMQKLGEGVDTYIPASKNLKVYTSVPGTGESKRMYRNKVIIDTIKDANDLVLVDGDFATPMEYYEKANEIYIVQDMDIMKLQETTMFLRELKNRGIDLQKVKIIVNKYVKCMLSAKRLVEGLSYYNDPQMSFVDELLDSKVQFFVVPFNTENYARYVDCMYKNSMDFKRFTPDFMDAVGEIANNIYRYDSSTHTKKRGLFG